MKRLLVPIILLALIGYFYFFRTTQQFTDYPRKQVSLGPHKLTLVLTDTEQRKITGLSGSKPLKDYEGMLFQFSVPGRYGFWMKDMKYSLDFLYLRNNKVVEVRTDVSPETYPDIILPTVDFDSMIEMNAGSTSKLNLHIGDVLLYN